jgi:hypothetical protein
VKRRPIPKDLQDELLFRSGRRCCVCHHERHDFGVKNYGQIAHLNRNLTDNRLDNLAYLCPEHYTEYDAHTSQSDPLTIRQVKDYRAVLYEEVDRVRKKDTWPPALDPPMLEPIGTGQHALETQGSHIQFADSDGWLNFAIRARLGQVEHTGNGVGLRRWLHVTVNMRPALTLRVEVRTWDDVDAEALVRFLRKGGHGCDLHGAGPDYNERHARDYVYFWHEAGEFRLVVSTFTATNAGIAIHARLSDAAAQALADYLQRVGFAALPQA